MRDRTASGRFGSSIRLRPGRLAITAQTEPYRHYHKDGSLWVLGLLRDDRPDGYWEWFRKDGTRLRSGHFRDGAQVGEWTTYDRGGKVYKVTVKKMPANG